MATGNYENDYCFEDSDQEEGLDSEEDIEKQINSMVKKSSGKTQEKLVKKPDSSDDEFEQAMSRELDCKITKGFTFHKDAIANSSAVKAEAENDALFYDPKMDEDDEAWVKKQRIIISGTEVGDKQLPRTDAVLNCPACLCQLCTDCQRHSLYDGQYRAMFVTNCLINYGETLKFKKMPKSKNRKRKLKTPMDSGNQAIKSDFSNMDVVPPGPIDTLPEGVTGSDITEEEALYNPVICSNCNTKVALYDQDEVYHFFNTVTSYG